MKPNANPIITITDEPTVPPIVTDKLSEEREDNLIFFELSKNTKRNECQNLYNSLENEDQNKSFRHYVSKSNIFQKDILYRKIYPYHIARRLYNQTNNCHWSCHIFG